jgi:hypothetical protein
MLERDGLPPLVPIDDLHPIDADAVRRISGRAYHDGECVMTTHSRDRTGYAVFSVGGLRSHVARYITALSEGLSYEDYSWQARHTCDNPSCINPAHLISGTVADNANDKVMRGRSTRGERSASARLNVFDVLALRLFQEIPATVFAEWFGVTPRAAQQARSGRTWWHLNNLVPPVKGRRGARSA